MATSSSTQKPTSKTSRIIFSNHHTPDKKYAGWVFIGGVNHFTEWFDSADDAELELHCLKKKLNYELIETVEMEGFYPERAKIIEEMYQASGRTNGLYTGLCLKDG